MSQLRRDSFVSIKTIYGNQKKINNPLLPLSGHHGSHYLSVSLLPDRLMERKHGVNEKGYYFTVLMSVYSPAFPFRKAVADQLEGIPEPISIMSLAWFATMLSILLMTVGLWNAKLAKSEKGFYAMSYVLSLFAAIAVQKEYKGYEARKNKEDKPWKQF